MPLLVIRKEQLITALSKLGIQKRDGLLVHSALQFLGYPEEGVGMYFDALLSAVGSNSNSDTGGTIAVPTFTFAFARGEAFDLQATPSEGMGVFSEYVRQLPQALRTPHPMQSLAVVGNHAEDLANRDTSSVFERGSTFDRMLKLDFKLLLLGANVQAASIIHYSELRAKVPYRYWKEFTSLYRRSPSMEWEKRAFRMFVRDLELDPMLDLSPVQRLLNDRAQWKEIPINYGSICVCRLVDFVVAADDLLAADPWVLVRNRGM
jgi:aminoglycoside 3-N-acetyltransferase